MTNRINDLRGNSRDRKSRKIFLLCRDGNGVEFETVEQVVDSAIAPCHECGAEVDYHTMIVDRIDPGKNGGRYTRDNIQIHCSTCSLRQGYRLGMGATRTTTNRSNYHAKQRKVAQAARVAAQQCRCATAQPQARDKASRQGQPPHLEA